MTLGQHTLSPCFVLTVLSCGAMQVCFQYALGVSRVLRVLPDSHLQPAEVGGTGEQGSGGQREPQTIRTVLIGSSKPGVSY